MELVARADGVLRQVAVAEGQTVPVGNVVAVIAAPGESPDVPAATSPRPAPTPAVGSGERGAVLVAAAPRPTPTAPADATRVKASPLARRIAREAGVDLKLVTGSGPGGRVVKRDVEAGATQARAATPTPVSRLPAPSGAPYEDVQLTQIRKTIAKRLAAAIGPIPHFFLTTEIDMERAAEAREALNKQLGEAGG